MSRLIHEDDLLTFEGYLQYQGIDRASLTPEGLKEWREIFDEAIDRRLTAPKVGLMELRPVAGEHRYAVAVRDGSDLWLTLWVRCSRKGEFFVMVPRGDRGWDPHTSYHRDGTFHMKSHGHTGLSRRRQPLRGSFRGTENLGVYSCGHGPNTVGAICDATAFSGVVEVTPGVLGPMDGLVVVDLVEPGCDPMNLPGPQIVQRKVFRDVSPWVVIRIQSTTTAHAPTSTQSRTPAV